VLKSVKEQLRKIPHRGAGFLALRYLCDDPTVRAKLRYLPAPQVSFNYMGQMDAAVPDSSPFRPAGESRGSERGGTAQRSHLIDINGAIAGGRLHLEWTYSRHIHRRQTIDNLAADFLLALQTLIRHCQSPDAGGYTPSDFSLAKLDQKKLDRIVQNIRKHAGPS
jgi:non-ribosomal peptide synthase protein (TIGR01720 family)